MLFHSFEQFRSRKAPSLLLEASHYFSILKAAALKWSRKRISLAWDIKKVTANARYLE